MAQRLTFDGAEVSGRGNTSIQTDEALTELAEAAVNTEAQEAA